MGTGVERAGTGVAVAASVVGVGVAATLVGVGTAAVLVGVGTREGAVEAVGVGVGLTSSGFEHGAVTRTDAARIIATSPPLLNN